MSGVFQDAYETVLETPAALGALAAAASFDVKGFKSQTLALTGTFVATLTFEATIDDVNWFAIGLVPIGGGAAVSSATAVGAFTLPAGLALSQVRARVSAYTSGSVQVTSRKHPR